PTDRRWRHLRRGEATLLTGDAGDPRTAARDTTRAGQAPKADGVSQSQPAAEPRTYRSSRTPPPDQAHSLTECFATVFVDAPEGGRTSASMRCVSASTPPAAPGRCCGTRANCART